MADWLFLTVVLLPRNGWPCPLPLFSTQPKDGACRKPPETREMPTGTFSIVSRADDKHGLALGAWKTAGLESDYGC